jgi:disulfide bond formation protein DsbB
MISQKWFWFGLVSSLGLLAVAYFYFEKQLGLAPCPLCMFQRACLAGIAVVCVFGILLRPKFGFGKLFALLNSLFAGLGLAIAGRQVWLQSLPEDRIPECGPDLQFMLDAFPLMEVISTVLQGSGECAEVQWQFLSLSMPAWMVIIFAMMLLVSLKHLFKGRKRVFSSSYR